MWTALTEVPAGTTISYGEMAKRAGEPGAAQAARSASCRSAHARTLPRKITVSPRVSTVIRRASSSALRFRAADRTLTQAEASEARDAAVALAASRHGAELRA